MLEFYDHDKMFPCYGFGAGLPPNNVTSHCFPLNGQPHSPEVAGVQGILEAYRCAEQGGQGEICRRKAEHLLTWPLVAGSSTGTMEPGSTTMY